MSKNTSIVTTFSGLLGGTKVAQGVGAYQSSFFSVEYLKIIVAAAISATIGYFVKLLFDAFVNALKKRMEQ